MITLALDSEALQPVISAAGTDASLISMWFICKLKFWHGVNSLLCVQQRDTVTPRSCGWINAWRHCSCSLRGTRVLLLQYVYRTQYVGQFVQSGHIYCRRVD